MTGTELAALVAAHADAVLTQLRADTALTDSVFEGEVTGGPRRYLNVRHNLGSWSAQRLDDRQIDLTTTFTLHGVGTTREQAVWVGGHAMGQLLNFRPIIAGRKCWRLTHEVSRPVQWDRDIDPPLFYTVDQFDLRSTPS